MKHIAIYPGTFDPIHLGHVDIASRAANIFDELIVAVYDRPAKTLMFSVDERVALAREALADLESVRVVPYGGLTVEVAHQLGAQAIVRGRMKEDGRFYADEILLKCPSRYDEDVPDQAEDP